MEADSKQNNDALRGEATVKLTAMTNSHHSINAISPKCAVALRRDRYVEPET